MKGLEQAAMALFDVPFAASELPVAPFRYLGDCGSAPEGYCLNADPVHLRADNRGLLLFDADSLSISATEAAELTATLQALLNADGWKLREASPEHWYLTGPVVADLQTTPLAQVRGTWVGPYLPRGRSAAEWLNRSNELQMVLHSHSVNRQRAERGAPAINSLWLWGGGSLPQSGSRCFEQVYSHSGLIRGLALWSGSDCAALPAQACDLLSAHDRGRLLLTLDACQRPAAYEDLAAWNIAVQNFERDWFAPLLEALLKRRIKQLELLPLNGYRYLLRSRDVWRLWRRDRSYRTLLCTAAS